MRLLQRPVSRFVVWVIFLIAVAAVTAAAGLRGWLIAVAELIAWTIVTLVERTLWRSARVGSRPGASSPPVASPRAYDLDPEAETELTPEPVAVPVGAGAPAAAEREPGRRRMLRQPVQPAPVRSLVRFNVWSLEKIADAHPEVEELEFMAVSLREFADADGQLPADFDPLVRESFGDLLPG